MMPPLACSAAYTRGVLLMGSAAYTRGVLLADEDDEKERAEDPASDGGSVASSADDNGSVMGKACTVSGRAPGGGTLAAE